MSGGAILSSVEGTVVKIGYHLNSHLPILWVFKVSRTFHYFPQTLSLVCPTLCMVAMQLVGKVWGQIPQTAFNRQPAQSGEECKKVLNKICEKVSSTTIVTGYFLFYFHAFWKEIKISNNYRSIIVSRVLQNSSDKYINNNLHHFIHILSTIFLLATLKLM